MAITHTRTDGYIRAGRVPQSNLEPPLILPISLCRAPLWASYRLLAGRRLLGNRGRFLARFDLRQNMTQQLQPLTVISEKKRHLKPSRSQLRHRGVRPHSTVQFCCSIVNTKRSVFVLEVDDGLLVVLPPRIRQQHPYDAGACGTVPVLGDYHYLPF